MITDEKLKEIKETIIKGVSPEKIILFGSYAKGEAEEDSDLDLIVVWDTNLNKHERNYLLRRLFPGRNFSLDIFAFTQEEVKKLENIPGTLVYEAFQHGKVVYE